MSESNEHKDLVCKIVHYVRSIVPPEYVGNIKADLDGYEKPSMAYDSFIPDVMYCYGGVLLLGEAKTSEDFSREHSKQQYKAYMNECAHFYGESIVVVAVPWDKFVTAKNHFRLLKSENEKIKIIVISSAGVVGIL